MDEIDIGEVRRRTGLTAATLRYYEARNLIRPSGRNGLRRRYTRDVLDRLTVIRAAQYAGFTLAEVRDLLEARSTDRELRGGLAAKADELDARIDLLTEIRDQLRHAAACSSPRLIDCPHFQRCLHDTPAEAAPPPALRSRSSANSAAIGASTGGRDSRRRARSMNAS